MSARRVLFLFHWTTQGGKFSLWVDYFRQKGKKTVFATKNREAQ